jgi:C4-dicarboxylate-specific signal transduction histidine kinase
MSPLSLYATAVLLVAAALGIILAFRPFYDFPAFYSPFFFCAIVISSWLGGFRPGIVATLLSFLALDFFLTPPFYSLAFSAIEIPRFLGFAAAGWLISWVGGLQRRDEAELLRSRDELEDKVRARTADLQVANNHLVAEVNERIRAQQELQRLNGVLLVRTACNQAVTRSASEAELLKLACEAVVNVGKYPLAWIAYAQPTSGAALRPMARAGQNGDDDLLSAPFENGRSHPPLPGSRQDQPIVCHQLLSDPALQDWREWARSRNVQSFAAFPLILDGTVLGRLTVCSELPGAFEKAETNLLAETAHDLAQGVALFRARQAQQQAEDALRKTEADLSRVARASTLGELTASIAHEINQPLSATVTNANACLRWLSPQRMNLDEARAAAQRIVRDGNRAAEIIARVRALLAKGQPTRQRVEINSVIEELLLLLQAEFRRRDVTLDRALGSDLPAVSMDRIQIQQLLMNLIVNGLDAMHSIVDRPRVLRIHTGAVDSEILFVAVEDCGVGLHPDQTGHLFDPFYTTKTEGLGMGLAISRSIAESHGGRLEAISNNGPGATFRFTLPVVEEVGA